MGRLYKTKKITLGQCAVTSLSYRAWISREARDPLLLVNSTDDSVSLFRCFSHFSHSYHFIIFFCSVLDYEGSLQLKRKFQNRHRRHFVRSTFCPIMSFRQGACVGNYLNFYKFWQVTVSIFVLTVTGSEDGSVYFLDVEKSGHRAIVNTLQGHANAVLGVSFNYDESLLATSDLQGLVIIWKRRNLN